MTRHSNEFDDFEWSRGKTGGRRKGSLLLSGFVCLVIVYGLGVWSGVQFSRTPGGQNSALANGGVQQWQGQSQQNQGQSQDLQGGTSPEADGSVITDIYNTAKNSIVTITAVTTDKSSKNNPQEDVGTGFLIDTEGDVATNDHVVNGAETVSVTLGNHTYTGRVIGADPLDDLAMVKIEPPANVAPLQLGTAKNLQPGQLVVAIGNPFQLTSSVSSGIVSGLNRSMPTETGHVMSGLVQTDAALNPGNSGGPLLNASGEVIGINTAIESPVEGSVGIGFAIPVDRLKQLMPKLLSGKNVEHAWLGIEGLDIDKLVQQELKLSVSEGVYVTVVTKPGPAQMAGLKGDSSDKISSLDNSGSYGQALNGDGDIIVGVDGQKITSVEALTEYLMNKAPGDSIALSVVRNGKQQIINVVLSNWPSASK
jgi:S1-C subfamily serine protease